MSLSTLLMQMVIAIRSWTACLIRRSVFNITWMEMQKTLNQLKDRKCWHLQAQIFQTESKSMTPKPSTGTTNWLKYEIWAKQTSEERMRSDSPLLLRLWRGQFHLRSGYSTWLHQRNLCGLNKTRLCISIGQNSAQDRWLETKSTWGVHNVEQIRFAPGVGQHHCDGGTLDTNSPLQKHGPATKITKCYWKYS